MHKPRILIVEDESFVALDLEETISNSIDAEIVMSDSIAGAKVLMELPVDFALLDINFAGGPSFEVADLLLRREVPFVFISGAPREELPAQLRCVPFIRKPYGRSHILRRLLELLPDGRSGEGPPDRP